ncbi:UNVERIFIED_CONTAM: Histidine kinase [Sesamum radiatum]|uniref:histidine kinase n=1 Tax=Sesamum radiatum TaxID=300843 RepID=A0AAW2KYQ4_SESRA
MNLEKLLEASLRREQILLGKLQESIENLERQSSPVEELSQVLMRADNFLHFVLQNAPVVIGHQVIGDVLRIRQILTNLVSNAIKFTHEGKVGIKLYVVPAPHSLTKQDSQKMSSDQTSDSATTEKELSMSAMEEDKVSRPDAEEPVVWIRCDVYDTGIGIPEHAMPTLFKKYMQVGADTARKYGGTGLGLAICKQLVELMGGYLTVSSKEHCGSTFTFILPYKVSLISDSSDDSDELSHMENQDFPNDGNDDDFTFRHFSVPTTHFGFSKGHSDMKSHFHPYAQSTSFSRVSEKSNKTSETSVSQEKYQTHEERDRASECSSSYNAEIPTAELKPKILLVEDNKINVMVTKSMMKQLGHNVDVVNNGAEALRAVQRQNYDLILMDVCMPVMDGLQATRLIRSFEETGSWDDAVKAGIQLQLPPENSSPNSQEEKPGKRIPIIAMTANALSESADDCFANGMDSFVSKPISIAFPITL